MDGREGRLTLWTLLLAAPVVLACFIAPPSPAHAETIDDDASLTEVAAYLRARSAFERHCFRCHTAKDGGGKKALERLDMGRYPFAGRRASDAGRAVRRTLGASGSKATMPQDDPQVVVGEDLAIILKWADVFDAIRGAAKQ
jgi:hypothetical protein